MINVFDKLFAILYNKPQMDYLSYIVVLVMRSAFHYFLKGYFIIFFSCVLNNQPVIVPIPVVVFTQAVYCRQFSTITPSKIFFFTYILQVK